MSEPVAVVIGAGRGIGLALVEALSAKGAAVLATVRKQESALNQIGGVEVVEGVELADDDGLDPVLAALGDRRIELLIIASGVQDYPDDFENTTKETIRRQVEINTIGPLFAVKALQPKFQHAAKVVLLSSKNASITETEATGGLMYGYRISKAGLNIAGKVLAMDLQRLNESPVALIHPGVVFTDMIRKLRRARGVPEDKLADNTLTPSESASRILGLIDGLTLDNSGSYWGADTGKTIGW